MTSVHKIADTDHIPEITALLHRAYQRLAERGLNYTAATQTQQITAERMAGGHTYVAQSAGQVVGVITVHKDQDHLIYRQPGTHVIGPFAVEPKFQGQGIGDALLRFVEKERLSSTYALDTAVPATQLVHFYQMRGYRRVGKIRWRTKSYESVVLAKAINEVPYLVHPAQSEHQVPFAEVVQDVYREYGFTYEPDGYHKDLFTLNSAYPLGFWVATNAEGKVLGGAGLKAYGTEVEVARMYVHPSTRNLGIGSTLMRVLINEAKSLRFSALHIWTDTAFDKAHRLYQRFGAQLVGQRICPGDPDQATEHGMILNLDNICSP